MRPCSPATPSPRPPPDRLAQECSYIQTYVRVRTDRGQDATETSSHQLTPPPRTGAAVVRKGPVQPAGRADTERSINAEAGPGSHGGSGGGTRRGRHEHRVGRPPGPRNGAQPPP